MHFTGARGLCVCFRPAARQGRALSVSLSRACMERTSRLAPDKVLAAHQTREASSRRRLPPPVSARERDPKLLVL